jgi:hypothetical protein
MRCAFKVKEIESYTHLVFGGVPACGPDLTKCNSIILCHSGSVDPYSSLPQFDCGSFQVCKKLRDCSTNPLFTQTEQLLILCVFLSPILIHENVFLSSLKINSDFDASSPQIGAHLTSKNDNFVCSP